MKQFDLEQAKAGKPVCTRDGRDARIICFDRKGDRAPIVALIHANGDEVIEIYSIQGKKWSDRNKENSADLFMKSVPAYRPFESVDEAAETIKEHGDWVKYKKNLCWRVAITGYSNTHVIMGDRSHLSFVDAFDDYIFVDGTPFGKLVEE